MIGDINTHAFRLQFQYPQCNCCVNYIEFFVCFGMEIDLENVDWKVLKFTGTAKAFKKTFNDAFIRKFGHYLK